ncbi:MAG TPA: hypothetical protein VMR21_02695 [Vicinamibacteria bacterium]|nr:hypothetical protein [Vicinamibacteria bacterium]
MKQRTVVAATALAMGLAAVAGPEGARTPGVDDDLAVVRKAVASPSPAASRPPRGRSAETRPLAPSREPRWFKVRVVDRVSGRKKVTINLPLTLVRALGDDTVDWGCREGRLGPECHTIRISEVLRSLEAGQELVEIEADEASVKVWVE